MSNDGAAPRAAVRRVQCPCRGQPEERREVARAEDARGQGARGAKCAEARHARAEIRRCCRRRMPPRSRRSRRRSSRSWRRKASLQTCSRAASRSPPGVWSAPIAWRPRCSEFRSYEDANAGLALIRDGNATRSFETLMRYRSAAMAEFWRALKTLKALQAEQAAEQRQAPRSSRWRRGSPASQRARPSGAERTLSCGNVA